MKKEGKQEKSEKSEASFFFFPEAAGRSEGENQSPKYTLY